jgi:pimeloyl-ACP methyl ester carboxylesterase
MDGFFSVAEQRALVEALPNATYVLYPNTGHAPHAELRHQFVHDVQRFLKSVTK